MQNQTLIQQLRARIAPLVEGLTSELDAAAAAEVESEILNKARYHNQRGIACGRTATHVCGSCQYVESITGSSVVVCDWLERTRLSAKEQT
jgi:hypothetical protein